MMQEKHEMKTLVLGTSLALVTLAATPTLAATYHSRVSAQQPNAEAAYAAADNGPTVNGPAVFAFGRYAGWDPDPAIRLQLMRDPGWRAD
ncbi:MAG: hypothetical protein HY244_09990 [Rhizobiales bacterium]|nr:hypothetical protein [Hyphomicrobiales bacterium]